MEPLNGDCSSATARPARAAVKHSAVICRYRMVFVMVFILRFAFLWLFFCFEVRRGQSAPRWRRATSLPSFMRRQRENRITHLEFFFGPIAKGDGEDQFTASGGGRNGRDDSSTGNR